jgi:hypothetical protein
MNKSIVTLFAVLAMNVAFPVFADRGSHFRAGEIAPRIDRVRDEIANYLKGTDKLRENAVLNLRQSLSNFDATLQNLNSALSSGFDGCSPRMRQVSKDFASMKQQFLTGLSTHPNYRVRLGWHKMEMAFWEMDWALTRGQSLN